MWIEVSQQIQVVIANGWRLGRYSHQSCLLIWNHIFNVGLHEERARERESKITGVTCLQLLEKLKMFPKWFFNSIHNSISKLTHFPPNGEFFFSTFTHVRLQPVTLDVIRAWWTHPQWPYWGCWGWGRTGKPCSPPGMRGPGPSLCPAIFASSVPQSPHLPQWWPCEAFASAPWRQGLIQIKCQNLSWWRAMSSQKNFLRTFFFTRPQLTWGSPGFWCCPPRSRNPQ